MRVKAIHTITHGGEAHMPGTVLDLGETECARLFKLGAAVEVDVDGAEVEAEPVRKPRKNGKSGPKAALVEDSAAGHHDE